VRANIAIYIYSNSELRYFSEISGGVRCMTTGNSVCGTCVKLFADDTNLFVFSNDVVDLQIDASEKLTLLSNWFIANMLSLSIDKTCYSVFGATDIDKPTLN